MSKDSLETALNAMAAKAEASDAERKRVVDDYMGKTVADALKGYTLRYTLSTVELPSYEAYVKLSQDAHDALTELGAPTGMTPAERIRALVEQRRLATELQITELKLELEAVTKDFDALLAVRARLVHANDELRGSVDSIKARFEELRTENDKLEAEAELRRLVFSEREDNLRASLTKLEQDNESLRHRLDHQAETIRRLEGMDNVRLASIAGHIKDKGLLEEKVANLRSSLSAVDKTNNELRAKLEAVIDEARAQDEARVADIKAERAEREELHLRFDLVREELRLSEERRTPSQDVATLRSALRALTEVLCG